MPGIDEIGLRVLSPGTTKSGWTTSDGSSVVSRTSSRSATVRRSRCGRFAPGAVREGVERMQ